jgi:hypothetical protein
MLVEKCDAPNAEHNVNCLRIFHDKGRSCLDPEDLEVRQYFIMKQEVDFFFRQLELGVGQDADIFLYNFF